MQPIVDWCHAANLLQIDVPDLNLHEFRRPRGTQVKVSLHFDRSTEQAGAAVGQGQLSILHLQIGMPITQQRALRFRLNRKTIQCEP